MWVDDGIGNEVQRSFCLWVRPSGMIHKEGAMDDVLCLDGWLMQGVACDSDRGFTKWPERGLFEWMGCECMYVQDCVKDDAWA